jgi:hypothetical protein
VPDERLPADLPDQASDPADQDSDPADRAPDLPDQASDDPAPADPAPAADGALPTEEWLLAHAVEGRVRRAPRLGSFIVAGVLAGLILGTVLTLLAVRGSGLSPEGSGGVLPMLGGYNGVVLVTSLALGLVGGLAGAALAVRADRRSRR